MNDYQFQMDIFFFFNLKIEKQSAYPQFRTIYKKYYRNFVN